MFFQHFHKYVVTKIARTCYITAFEMKRSFLRARKKPKLILKQIHIVLVAEFNMSAFNSCSPCIILIQIRKMTLSQDLPITN